MEVTNSEEGLNYWPLLLYYNFKSSDDQNSLSFIRFQRIHQDSEVLFSDF